MSMPPRPAPDGTPARAGSGPKAPTVPGAAAPAAGAPGPAARRAPPAPPAPAPPAPGPPALGAPPPGAPAPGAGPPPPPRTPGVPGLTPFTETSARSPPLLAGSIVTFAVTVPAGVCSQYSLRAFGISMP